MMMTTCLFRKKGLKKGLLPDGILKTLLKSEDRSKSMNMLAFPPEDYRPNVLNTLLANALDLTAPASDALVKNRKNTWVQIAGHPDSFAPAGPNTIWKKRLTKDNNETMAYQLLMSDMAKDIVPKFYREVEYNNEIFIEIDDLLQYFHDPHIMDIKMGTRTFLESEVKNPVQRTDLYQKMIKLDPEEPTALEHDQKAVTKLRYMQFREQGSSTSTLGFRIEAVKKFGETCNTNLKQLKEREQVLQAFGTFLSFNRKVVDLLLRRFREMRQKFQCSKFFKNHEVIGSSILILYDKTDKVSAWMIDFAKTLAVEQELTHRALWSVGNHEDGYLTGLDSLIELMIELDKKIANKEYLNFETRKPNTPPEGSKLVNQTQSSNQTSPAFTPQRRQSPPSTTPEELSGSGRKSSCASSNQRSRETSPSLNLSKGVHSKNNSISSSSDSQCGVTDSSKVARKDIVTATTTAAILDNGSV